MLKVYLGNTPKKIIKYNDAWFQENIEKIDFNNPNIIGAMQRIDGARYNGNFGATTQFSPNAAVSILEISTGCKTTINVCQFTNEIFTVAECGENALEEIFKLDNGSIYVAYQAVMPKFDSGKVIKLVIDGNSRTITNYMDLRLAIKEYFRSEVDLV